MSELTNIDVGSDYMNFVYEFHKTMVNQRLTLVYEGEVNQSITKAFTTLAEKKLDEGEDSSKTKKRLYHVMVECLQNVCKHADEETSGTPDIPGKGIFMVGEGSDNYTVTTGNVIANDRVEEIKDVLSKINEMSPEEIKEYYKMAIKASRLSEKAGAGLGFIDIVKKTGNDITYHFEKINDLTSFVILKSTITRD